MGSLGMQEIIVIFILALIVFGPRKLPELGKTIGKSLAEFKKASNELKQTWEEEVRLDKEKEAISDIVNEKEAISDIMEDSSIGSKEIQ
jgi:sec-independent protein translocase protein TatA